MEKRQTQEQAAATPEQYLQATREEAEQAVKRVMGGFDFDRAAMALRGCGWKYEGATESPTADELREMARKEVRNCIDSGSGVTIYCGPLMVRSWHYDSRDVVTVELMLRPIQSSAVYFDCRPMLSRQIQRAAKRSGGK